MPLKTRTVQLDKVPAHDYEAHGGKALSQTGFRKGCHRCRWLKRKRKPSIYERQFMGAK